MPSFCEENPHNLDVTSNGISPSQPGTLGTSVTKMKSIAQVSKGAIRLITAFAFIVIATLSLAMPSSASGRITIHPTGTVRVGQVITVTGVGFVHGDAVYITECFKTSCDIESATPARISNRGLLPPTHFRLVGTFPNKLQCGPKTSAYCHLWVGNASGNDAATVAIEFKRTP